MIDKIKYIFDSSQFQPRGQCGKWEEPWIEMYMHGHLLVFVSYLAIFLILMSAVKLRKGHALENLATITYALFIMLCGVSHLIDGVIVFQYPMYRAIAVFMDLLALVSLGAVVVTMKIRNKFITVFS